jgi:hypothetical protein
MSLSFWRRRWCLSLLLVSASLPGGMVLASLLAAPGYYLTVAIQVTLGFLAGPSVHYFIYTGSSDVSWALLALVCLPFMAAHPIHPRFVTGVLTVGGYAVWYYLAGVNMISVGP